MYVKSTLLLALLALISTAQARSFAEIKKSGVLNIYTNAEYEPFMFYNANKELDGFEHDLGNELAKRLGLRAEWTDRPFSALLVEVNTKPDAVDMVIASHAINSTRAKQVNFSNPHYCTGSAILSRVGGPKTSKELVGRQVGAEVGSQNLSFLRKLPQVTIVPFTSSQEAIKAVIDGKIDSTVEDEIVLLQAAKANPAAKLQVSPAMWRSGSGMAFAKSKQSDELRFAINKALKESIQDGTYQKLSEKWFGRNIRC